MTAFIRHNQYLVHWCEGCENIHLIPDCDDGKPRWSFNGDYNKPTLSPSVLHSQGTNHVCHYFIKDGMIQYCGDSHHKLKSQTLPLKDIPDDEMEWLVK